MIILGAALRRQQVVITVHFVQVRCFRQFNVGPFKNNLFVANQLLLAGTVFLKHDAIERMMADTLIPQHVDQIFLAVLIME
ncbi:hypothetical protein D3C77_376790 [compost metagenome]